MDEKAICSAEIAALAADMENQEMADGLGTCLANAIKSTEEFKVLPRNGKSGILTYTGELVKKAYNSIKDAVANNGSYEFDLTECEEQANQIAQDGGNLASKMCGTIKSAAGKIYDMVKVPDDPVNPVTGGDNWTTYVAIGCATVGLFVVIAGSASIYSKLKDKRKDNILNNAEFGPEAGATKIVSNRTENNVIQPVPNNNLDQGEENSESSSSSHGGDGPDNGNGGGAGGLLNRLKSKLSKTQNSQVVEEKTEKSTTTLQQSNHIKRTANESDIISTKQQDQQLPIFEGKAMDPEDQKKFDEEFKLPEEKEGKSEQTDIQQETVDTQLQNQQSLTQQDNENVEETAEKEQITLNQLQKQATAKSQTSVKSAKTNQSAKTDKSKGSNK